MVIAVRTETIPPPSTHPSTAAAPALVVVKEGTTDADRARLAAEAEALRRARHPGVVELLDERDGSLVLAHAGTALSQLGPLPLDQAAAVVSAVADVLQAVHRQGVAHGALGADHVVLDRRGRPRLCGFGDATDASDVATADDVAALGALLEGLLDTGGHLPWAVPPSGLGARAQRSRIRRDLDAAVVAATRTEPDARPSARQLAKAIHAAVPDLALPTTIAPPTDSQRTFAAIPDDVEPTADLAWTDDDLSFLAADTTDPDIEPSAPIAPRDPARDAPTPGRFSISLPVDAATAPAMSEHAESDDGIGDGHDDAPGADTTPPALTSGLSEPSAEPSDPEPAAPGPTQAGRWLDEAPDTGVRLGLPYAALEPDAPRRRLPLPAVRTVAAAVLLTAGLVGGVTAARAVQPFDTSAGAVGPATTAPTTTTPSDASSTTEPTATTAPDATTADGGLAAGPPLPPPWPDHCTVPSPTGPDVDGDGCPEPITLDGRRARVGERIVEIGDDGDRILLGDWDCDGVATPAVLRPTTGEVFVFARWQLDAPVSIAAETVVPGSLDLTASPDPCPRLLVEGPDGPVDVEIRS